jgi:hypothetical protein
VVAVSSTESTLDPAVEAVPPPPAPTRAKRLVEGLTRLLLWETVLVVFGVLAVSLVRTYNSDASTLAVAGGFFVVMLVVAFLVWPQWHELDHYKRDDVDDDRYWERVNFRR